MKKTDLLIVRIMQLHKKGHLFFVVIFNVRKYFKMFCLQGQFKHVSLNVQIYKHLYFLTSENAELSSNYSPWR